MKIIVDTREQLPYTFEDLDAAVIVARGTLSAGDYSVEGFEKELAIERKSLGDAYGTFGAGRERFVRELERMREFRYPAILIESSLVGLKYPPKFVSRVTPETIINSLISWSIDFRIPIWLACDREHGRRLVYKLCSTYHEKNAHRLVTPAA